MTQKYDFTPDWGPISPEEAATLDQETTIDQEVSINHEKAISEEQQGQQQQRQQQQQQSRLKAAQVLSRDMALERFIRDAGGCSSHGSWASTMRYK